VHAYAAYAWSRCSSAISHQNAYATSRPGIYVRGLRQDSKLLYVRGMSCKLARKVRLAALNARPSTTGKQK
jgi:hypothetical protein